MEEKKSCWHCGHRSVCELCNEFAIFIENRRMRYFGKLYYNLEPLYEALALNCEFFFKEAK